MIRYRAVLLVLATCFSFVGADTIAGDQDTADLHPDQRPITWKGTESLGEANFDTSCKNDNAQELVNVGLRLLHNFEYELARRNFQSAR